MIILESGLQEKIPALKTDPEFINNLTEKLNEAAISYSVFKSRAEEHNMTEIVMVLSEIHKNLPIFTSAYQRWIRYH